MIKQLLNNASIELFDSYWLMIGKDNEFLDEKINYNDKFVYSGCVSEIPREIAKKYFDYGYDDLEIDFTSLDESIKEITENKRFCVIWIN